MKIAKRVNQRHQEITMPIPNPDRTPTGAARLALLLAAAAAMVGCGSNAQSDGQHPERPPAAVTVTEVHPRSVTVEAEYAGRVRGPREVEVRARVDGILERRLYQEGQFVAQDEALFRIDREPYAIALAAAEAEQADAAAALTNAEREWERIRQLYAQHAVSRSHRDRTEAEFQGAAARLAGARAAVADARRSLRYTEVAAPIAGATGLEVVPEGSLLERGALLTTITQHDPVHVLFALPENDAAAQRAARRALGAEEAPEALHSARVRLSDGAWHPRAGTVNFTDSTIDQRTGTVAARAVFPNPDLALVPGQFVRVRVALERLEGVFVIDETAVGEGPEGAQVFVVDDQQIAHARPVRLGPVVEAGQVVLEGLAAGERLVVNGQVALRDGAPVTVAAADGGH